MAQVALCQSCRAFADPEADECPRCGSGVLFLMDRGALEEPPRRHRLTVRWRRSLAVLGAICVGLTLWAVGAVGRAPSEAPVRASRTAIVVPRAVGPFTRDAVDCGGTLYTYSTLHSTLIRSSPSSSGQAALVTVRGRAREIATVTYTIGTPRVVLPQSVEELRCVPLEKQPADAGKP